MSNTPGRWTPETPRSRKLESTFNKSICIMPQTQTSKRPIKLKSFPIYKSTSIIPSEPVRKHCKALTIYEPILPKFALPPIRKDPIFGKTKYLKNKIKIKKKPQMIARCKSDLIANSIFK